MTPESDNLADVISKFQTRFSDLPGFSSSRVSELRKNAIRQFEEHGLPNKKMEEWRNSNIREFKKYLFEFNNKENTTLVKDDLHHLGLYSDDVYTMVFLDGLFQEGLSSLDGLSDEILLHSIAKYIDEGDESDLVALMPENKTSHGFANLNTAFFTDGCLLKVPDGMSVNKPIHISYVTSEQYKPVNNYNRNILVFGEKSSCTLVESYYSLGQNQYGTNSVTELVPRLGSVINHYRVFSENANANHHSALHIRQYESSEYTCHNINAGGQVLRNEINVKLVAEECRCDLKMLDITSGNQSSENHVSIGHMAPNCVSNQAYKSVLFDKSNSVFNGAIYVARDAQKTDAKQSSNSLLLSKNAQVNTKPQLEIYADDVKCSHGATVGELSQEMVFYLQSRGISEPEARRMLAYGFCKEMVSEISNSKLKQYFENMILRKLDRSEHESVKKITI